MLRSRLIKKSDVGFDWIVVKLHVSSIVRWIRNPFLLLQYSDVFIRSTMSHLSEEDKGLTTAVHYHNAAAVMSCVLAMGTREAGALFSPD